MTKKFTKRLLTSLVIREMQIKTVRCDFTLRRLARITKTDTVKRWQGMQQKELSGAAAGSEPRAGK